MAGVQDIFAEVLSRKRSRPLDPPSGLSLKRPMPQITFAPNFEPWQRAARRALQQGVRPEGIEWQELESEQPALGLFEEMESVPANGATFRVPKEFLPLARKASFHRDERRWALLYRV